MNVLPHGLELLLADVVGSHERLPLRDEGLHGKPLAWARIRAHTDVSRLRVRLAEAGCRCTLHTDTPGGPHEGGAHEGGTPGGEERAFLLVRTPDGGRIEIDLPYGNGGPNGDEGPNGDGPTPSAAAFIEAFDRATHARRAGHSVACWQATNDAIAALLRHIWAATGGPATALLPPVRARLPRPLRDTLATLRSGLNLRDTLDDLRRLLTFAREASVWLGSPGGTALAAELDALERPLEADRFWNLRDVSLWWAPHLRPGVLLRGRSPTAYADEGFWAWAAENSVGRFVDLRGPTERAVAPYPHDVAGCAVCPLDLSNPRETPGIEGLDAAYVHIALRCAPALGAVLEAVADDEGPVLIHCHAGVDRTGVLVALLGAWLGVPRARIEADYLASGQLVERRRIASALATAEDYGLERLVEETGLPQTTLTRARARLLP